MDAAVSKLSIVGGGGELDPQPVKMRGRGAAADLVFEIVRRAVLAAIDDGKLEIGQDERRARLTDDYVPKSRIGAQGDHGGIERPFDEPVLSRLANLDAGQQPLLVVRWRDGVRDDDADVEPNRWLVPLVAQDQVLPDRQ